MRKNKLYIITFILTIILIFSTAFTLNLCGMPVEIETEEEEEAAPPEDVETKPSGPPEEEAEVVEEEKVAEEEGEEIEETEEKEEVVEGAAPEEEVSKEEGEEIEEAKEEEEKTPPTIELKIYEGPTYSAADDVCFYRVEAIVTGNPTPTVSFSKDDSGGAWGSKKVQINLKRNSPTYTLTATATNSSGSATDSIVLSWGCNGEEVVEEEPEEEVEESKEEVASGSNNPPSINSLTASQTTTGIGQTIKITADATDPDGDMLKYIWMISKNNIQPNIWPEFGKEFNWTAPNSPGNYKISLKVEDGKGGSATKDITISVKDIYVEPTEPEIIVGLEPEPEIIVVPVNRPPVLTHAWIIPRDVPIGEIFKVMAEGYDPDGDKIKIGTRYLDEDQFQKMWEPGWGITLSSISFKALKLGDYHIKISLYDEHGAESDSKPVGFITVIE